MPFNPEVDSFMTQKAHPRVEEMQKIREIIINTDSRVEEAIKWKTPTFMYKGNIASFMNAKKFVSLMFHKGAFIEDKYGLLEGDGKEARVARFIDMQDIGRKKPALESVIRAWIELQDS